MNILKENAISFFMAIGHKSAKKWTNKRLESKINGLGEKLNDVDADGLGEDEAKVLKLVRKSIKNDKKIRIIEPEDADETESNDSQEKGKKGKKGKKKEKVKKEKKVGVIATIIECLQGKKPVTKVDILDVLEERFPDRQRDSMEKTVNVQVPTRLKTDKGLIVEKDDKGRYSL